MDELLNIHDVTGALRVSRATVYRLIERGQLKAVKVGKSLRFRKQDIEEFLRNNEVQSEIGNPNKCPPPSKSTYSGHTGRKPSLPVFYHRQVKASTGVA